mmetsp:Transcript_42778/g.110935  ORF Transcript_42778/g.110935 Transcript_42778/m.110935 type:complete len:230 (-) Transcript_42778:72-761(-)
MGDRVDHGLAFMGLTPVEAAAGGQPLQLGAAVVPGMVTLGHQSPPSGSAPRATAAATLQLPTAPGAPASVAVAPPPGDKTPGIHVATGAPVAGLYTYLKARANNGAPYRVYDMVCQCGAKKTMDRRANMDTFLEKHARHMEAWAGLTADSVSWSAAVGGSGSARPRRRRQPRAQPLRPYLHIVRLKPSDWHKVALAAARSHGSVGKDFLAQVVQGRVESPRGATVMQWQ